MQTNAIHGCNSCGGRSNWDFLREFYQREEINKAQVQSLNQHVTQMNSALRHCGHTAQKDRVALNKAHEHLRELQHGFNQSEMERAKFENLLHEERQEHRLCQENLTHEKVRHEETEKHLECIWNSHKRLGDIVSGTHCVIDEDKEEAYGEYDITGLVLELEAKASRISSLEAEMKEDRDRAHSSIENLEVHVQGLKASQAEELAAAQLRYHELDLHFRREQARPFQDSPAATTNRRRRKYNGRGKNARLSETTASASQVTANDHEPFQPLIAAGATLHASEPSVKHSPKVENESHVGEHSWTV